MNETNTPPEKIGIGSHGAGSVSITGLTKAEEEALLGAFRVGTSLVRNDNGRLQIVPAYAPFPDPIKDAAMAPFWSAPTDDQKRMANEQLTLINLDKLVDHSSPSIYIGSLCAYSWSQENYEIEAAKLKSWGFDIMRSPRQTDGQYWEKWFLPGLWAVEGELKEYCEGTPRSDGEAKLKLVLEFLRAHVKFGTLDVSVQRLCMPHPD